MIGIRSPAPGRVLAAGLTQLIRRGLRGVWVRGELPVSVAVWAANHHSWWDGFVAAAVLRERQRPARLDELDAALVRADPRLPVPGFRCAVKGRASWDERITSCTGLIRR